MRTADFEYELPPELIAQTPMEPRDSSRLMVLDRAGGGIEHRLFRDLPGLLRAGDLLVVNDTRVMAARLLGRWRDTGGRVEALLLEELPTRRVELQRTGQWLNPRVAREQRRAARSSSRHWLAMLRPLRGARPGRVIVFESTTGSPLQAMVEGRDGDSVRLTLGRRIDPAMAGQVPLPPYIKGYRGDPERYQTVYALEARSAAAPTAGLHFTPELLGRLDEIGVERVAVTLEVGPGTFKPVTVDDPREHVLHAEHVTVPAASAERIVAARRAGRRVIAVGTTVVRTLEHVARECGSLREYAGWTSLKILPGDEFRVVDTMITNFHLPRSTLLMLVCAFAGRERVMEAYEAAIRERYRFYSFGDAMLIL